MSNKRKSSFSDFNVPMKRQRFMDLNNNFVASQPSPSVSTSYTRNHRVSDSSFDYPKRSIIERRLSRIQLVDKKPKASALFTQPAEIFNLIVGKLSLEDAFNLSVTCKAANRLVKNFQASMKNEWVDNMFLSLETDEEKASNAKHLFMLMSWHAKQSSDYVDAVLFEWFATTPKKCPNVPMPLLFEAALNSGSEQKAIIMIDRLVKAWMSDDARYYCRVFPVLPDSPSTAIEAEKRLLERFGWIFSGKLKVRSQAWFLAVLLRSLSVEIANVHKLIYLFCAPRNEEGFIDFTQYAVVQQQANDGTLNFGYMAEALKLLVHAWNLGIYNSFSNREIFVILEDLTTSPIVWSMHSFVKLLMVDVELCVLSTHIRFAEGYHDDAASTFYYMIRAGALHHFLVNTVASIASLMEKQMCKDFFAHVLRKSRQVIGACDHSNVERLQMLHDTHNRAFGAFNAGLSLVNMRYTARSASI